MRVGDMSIGPERYVPWTTVVETDSLVHRLNTEIMTAAAGPDAAKLGTLPVRWNIHFADWATWYPQAEADSDNWVRTVGLLGRGIVGPPFVPKFDALAVHTNDLRDEFVKLGGKSTTEPVDLRTPAEKAGGALGQAGSGILGGASTALSTVGQVLIYASAIGAAGLAVYYTAPFIAAKVFRR